MGNLFTKLFTRLTSAQQARILMLGLDGAGKTTLTQKLRFGEVVATTPTIGFSVDTVEFKNIKFNIWDIGGQDKLRALWKHYYNGTDGLIFVVDSTDKKRVGLAKQELHKMLAEEEMRDAIVLVMANKQDIATMSVAQITEDMGLHELKGREWYCQGTSAMSGAGMYEGLTWMVDKLNKRK